MERDGNDLSVQYYRWSLLAEFCASATQVAQAAIARNESEESTRVFDLALREVLKHDVYSKNDLTALSCTLMLGARALQKACSETQGFLMSSQTTPAPEPRNLHANMHEPEL